MFLLKNVWATQKDEPDQTILDSEDGNTSLYHNLTMVQDYQSLLSLTTMGDLSNRKMSAIERRRDLLSLYNYNRASTRNLIQFFKEIIMFQTIFMR